MKTPGGMEVSGFEEFRVKIKKLCADHEKELRAALSEIGDVALQECVNRAPIDEGNLVASLEKHIVDVPGELSVYIRIPLNSPSSDYAIPMHEDQYIPGQKSQDKSAKLGVEVGRKYITRGIEAGKPDYRIILQSHLEVK